jgi:hypothetical protein
LFGAYLSNGKLTDLRVDHLISIENDSDMFERFKKSMMMEFEII